MSRWEKGKEEQRRGEGGMCALGFAAAPLRDGLLLLFLPRLPTFLIFYLHMLILFQFQMSLLKRLILIPCGCVCVHMNADVLRVQNMLDPLELEFLLRLYARNQTLLQEHCLLLISST